MNKLTWFKINEKKHLDQLLKDQFGYYLLLFGNEPLSTLSKSPIKNHFAVQQFSPYDENSVISNFSQTPFSPNSVDLIILPHILESCDDVDALLEEVKLILRHDGKIIITGFNPLNPLALKLYKQNQVEHQSKRLLSLAILKTKLQEIGFDIIKINRFARPIKFLPWLSTGYAILLQKHSIALTPIKAPWYKKIFSTATELAYNKTGG